MDPHGGDGIKPKPGNNSISTCTKIVPVIKKKIPFIKNTKISTPKYPQTRNR
jgi:hypothetical protein